MNNAAKDTMRAAGASCLGRRVSLVRIQSPQPLFDVRGSTGVPVGGAPTGCPARELTVLGCGPPVARGLVATAPLHVTLSPPGLP